MTLLADERPNAHMQTRTASQALRLNSLTKKYVKSDDPAVDQLNMVADEGHLVALLGPSGCGKTTTLRMVAGLLTPTAGRIVVGDTDVTDIPVHKRGMGMVFQSYALFPHMNVSENVEFGLQMRKIDRKERNKRVSEVLNLVQLEHLAKRRTAELSGGQQQRIALARALVVRPTLLLLDEPLSNLDAKLRESMRREIRSIQQTIGTTTLFVTHDQAEALDLSDRIAVMNKGYIEQFGTPEEVFAKPVTKFVANFIGRANFIGVTVLGGQGKTESDIHYEVEGLGHRAPVKGPPGISAGPASLLVRPHEVRVDPGKDDRQSSSPSRSGVSNRFKLPGRVSTRSYTGNVVSYQIDCGNHLISTEDLAAAGPRLEIGDEVTVSWDAEDAFLVADAKDGEGQP